MRVDKILILLMLTFSLSIATETAATDRTRETRIDDGWLFHYGDFPNAAANNVDESTWRTVNLPHDWSIEDIPGTGSPFDSTIPNGVSSGFTRGGTAWYRKHLNISNIDSGNRLKLRFDGIYMNADIWVNGKMIANHFYGYTPVEIDISSYIAHDADNIIAVKVNTDNVTSRWYSGAGIYRHVYLINLPPVHIESYGTSVTTTNVSATAATVNLSSTLFNHLDTPCQATVNWSIFDNSGNKVSQTSSQLSMLPNDTATASTQLTVNTPHLWSVDTPVLYTLETTVSAGEGVTDTTTDRFGIRSITFDPDRGFFLNDAPMLLKGGCIHHDNGLLGAKAFDRAEIRKIQLLKNAGFNALRMAHNPPSPALLDACDSIGILVIDEAFDVWRTGHFDGDYSCRFDSLWRHDLKSMVMRDRNRPSIIMWSIGNEIKNNDTDSIAALSATMADFVRNIDNTRPVTAGVNSVSELKDTYLRSLDVAGYNYSPAQYVKGRYRNPGQLIYASESYASQAAAYWEHVERLPWVIGDFVWTAMDYIGEASIGWYGYDLRPDFFPWYLAYCGDIDICGNRRPQSYYRETIWSDTPTVYIAVVPPAPSYPINRQKQKWSVWDWPDEVNMWNFPGHENDSVKVVVYTNCNDVDLLLNGVSLGRKQVSDTTMTNKYSWPLTYRPGLLEAVAYNDGKPVARYTLTTAGTRSAITLQPNRLKLSPDNQDLCYIKVSLTDKNNTIDTAADDLIFFEIEGPAVIEGVGNGNPMSSESFTRPFRKAWRGECLAVIRAGNRSGTVTLHARTAAGLHSSVTLQQQ